MDDKEVRPSSDSAVPSKEYAEGELRQELESRAQRLADGEEQAYPAEELLAELRLKLASSNAE